MTEEERYQIKGALIKCAKENENKPTFTGHIVVSSLCKSAVERIEELEKENAELKQYAKALEETDNTNILHCMKVNGKLYKAKEIIKDYMTIVKGAHTTVCGVPEENRTIHVLKLNEEAEQFLKEIEK